MGTSNPILDKVLLVVSQKVWFIPEVDGLFCLDYADKSHVVLPVLKRKDCFYQHSLAGDPDSPIYHRFYPFKKAAITEKYLYGLTDSNVLPTFSLVILCYTETPISVMSPARVMPLRLDKIVQNENIGFVSFQFIIYINMFSSISLICFQNFFCLFKFESIQIFLIASKLHLYRITFLIKFIYWLYAFYSIWFYCFFLLYFLFSILFEIHSIWN